MVPRSLRSCSPFQLQLQESGYIFRRCRLVVLMYCCMACLCIEHASILPIISTLLPVTISTESVDSTTQLTSFFWTIQHNCLPLLLCDEYKCLIVILATLDFRRKRRSYIDYIQEKNQNRVRKKKVETHCCAGPKRICQHDLRTKDNMKI